MALIRANNKTIQNVTTLPTGIVSAGDLPSGAVLQVIYHDVDTATVKGSSTYASIGLGVNITPKSASSRIVALYNIQTELYANGQNSGNGARFIRGGTTLYTSTTTYDNYSDSSNGNQRRRVNWHFEDTSHNTTSTITYELHTAEYASTVEYSGNNQKSSVTLIEYAG